MFRSACPKKASDVVIAELRRACLEIEPQVAVTRHLLREVPGAVFVPEEVCVEYEPENCPRLVGKVLQRALTTGS